MRDTQLSVSMNFFDDYLKFLRHNIHIIVTAWSISEHPALNRGWGSAWKDQTGVIQVKPIHFHPSLGCTILWDPSAWAFIMLYISIDLHASIIAFYVMARLWLFLPLYGRQFHIFSGEKCGHDINLVNCKGHISTESVKINCHLWQQLVLIWVSCHIRLGTPSVQD